MNKLEIIIASLTALVVLYIIIPKDKKDLEPEVTVEENLPIVAWLDTQEHPWDGTMRDVVRIKYLVESENTILWVRDMAGRIVHVTPFKVSPYKHKPNRIHEYVWRLYESKRSEYIPPGDYEIIVGTNINNTSNYWIPITI